MTNPDDDPAKAGAAGQEDGKAPPPERELATTWPALLDKGVGFFGRYKAVVIAALFFIAIVAATMWLTRDTTIQLAEISQQQVAATSAVLKLHTDMLDQVAKTHQSLKTFSDDLLLTQTALTNTKNQLAAKERQIETLGKAHESELAFATKQRTDLAGKLRGSEATVNKQTEELKGLRGQLARVQEERDQAQENAKVLATALQNLSEQPGTTVAEPVRTLVANVTGTEIPDASPPTLEDDLRAIAQDPKNSDAFARIGRLMAKTSSADMNSLLREDLGFSVVYRKEDEYWSAVEIEKGILTDVFNFSPGQEQSFSILKFSLVNVVRIIGPSNFNIFSTILIASAPAYLTFPSLDLAGEKSTVQISEDKNWKLLFAKQSEPILKILDVKEFLAQDNEVVASWFDIDTPEYAGIHTGIWFSRRSGEFDRSDLASAGLGKLPRDAEAMVADLLVNVARREFVAAAEKAAEGVSRDQLGRLGAAAVYPDFRILAVAADDEFLRLNQELAKQGGAALRIEAEFGGVREYQAVEQVRLRLLREDPKSSWRLDRVEFPGIAQQKG